MALGSLNGFCTQAGGPFTVIYIVVLAKAPPGSVARTMKVLSPASELAGLPVMAPLPATLNQAGPRILLNVSVCPSGSTALVEIFSA